MKASGTSWVDHNWRAMGILFKNYGAYYISHLEQISFTNSQALTQSEIEGYVNKRK